MAYILGTHTTKFGELWDKDLRSLGVEAGTKAIANSGLEIKDIDAIYVGNMAASRFCGQDHLGALFAAELGTNVPAFHVEAACASGSMAVRSAYLDILSGTSKTVLVIGAEKMTDVDTAAVTSGLAGAADEEWEGYYGITFPSLYAMIAREHMNQFGTSREAIAMCAVKNHKNALKNPIAQYRREISLDQVLDATKVADPLGLLDCSPISDGASAIVLSSKHKSNVKISGIGQAQDSLSLHKREEITELKATQLAAIAAYKQAKIMPEDIAIAEVHDCFTIAEILAYEDLGFCDKGKGGDYIMDGKTAPDGEKPVNISGGLKACGHPVGATGVKQIAGLVEILNGNLYSNLELSSKYALAHNVGGSGATAIVTILEKLK